MNSKEFRSHFCLLHLTSEWFKHGWNMKISLYENIPRKPLQSLTTAEWSPRQREILSASQTHSASYCSLWNSLCKKQITCQKLKFCYICSFTMMSKVILYGNVYLQPNTPSHILTYHLKDLLMNFTKKKKDQPKIWKM